MYRPSQLLFCLLAATTAISEPTGDTIPLTIATANLTDAHSQAYQAPGIRILQALRPDILAIQEFNYKQGTSQDLVRELFGPDYHFAREKGGARLPNGVLSRYPIVASGQWKDPYVGNRSFFWATIAIPGPIRLHVISVHFVKRRANRRIPEARHVLRLIRKSFPPEDYVVLCGDLNLATRASQTLAALTTWFDDSAQPADQQGNKNTNANRSRPYDYVLPNPALAPHHVPTRLANQDFPGGLVFDTRLWDLPPPPARKLDTTRNFQHLPVMKTFRIPLDPVPKPTP